MRVALFRRAFFGHFTGLFGTIATKSNNTTKFAADRGLVAPKHFRNLSDGLLGINEAGNLISFDLAEVCEFQGQLR